MREFFCLIAVIIGGILSFLALGFVLVYPTGRYSCATHSEVAGQETKYAALTCYVKQDGKWMTWEEYKLRFATRGAN